MEQNAPYRRPVDFEAPAFGRRVAAAREWAGLKPKQLAERLGVSPEAVYRLERGTRLTSPRRAELRLLAETLDQSEEWLLRGESPPWTQRSTGSALPRGDRASLELLDHRLESLEADVAEVVRLTREALELLRASLQRADVALQSPLASERGH